MSVDFSVIGKGVPRNDAVLKATGHAHYGADISMPGMLFGKVLRSPHPHARILNINIDKARKLMGVKDLVTGKDFPGHKYGFTEKTRDQTPLAIDKVRYIGDEVAAVAAIDEDTAEEALDLITVDYEILPAVFDPEEAMREGAPLIHDDRKNNISSESHFLFGDIDEGFRDADYIDEDVYKTQAIKHGFLEPHATLAHVDATGKVTLWGGKQSPYVIYRKLAMGLNIPLDKLRIIQTYVGGGFGSARSDTFALDFCSILMAQRTNKPVKFIYTMRDVFVMGEMRHPFIMYVKTGVKKDGRITAIQARNILDGGAYSSIGPLTVALPGFFMIIPYKVPNVRYDGYRVYTNKGFCGSLRGHGIAQMRFALGSQLDKIAHEIGMDPLQIHRINALESGDITAQGHKITSCGFTECLEKAAEASHWRRKKGTLPPYRGIGMGASSYCSGVKMSGHSCCTAVIKMNEDGKAFLATGATDIGQGSNTVLAQIAAEVLGIGYGDIKVNEGVDTDLTPVDPGSYSSRVTFYAGNAVKKAAENIKRELMDIVATYFGVGREAILFKDRRVFIRDEPKKGFMMDELIRFCQSKLSRVVIGHASWDSGVGFMDFRTGKGNMSAAYSFAADVVEVEVDPDTGKVKILKIVGAHDVGRVINPVQCIGQLNGAYVMAQGQLLYEDLIRKDGRVLNPNFRDYKIPTSMDIGEEYKHIFVETNDPLGPFGAKEVAEGASVAIFPALANAIYDAIGVRINELPITPERILKAIKEKKLHDAR